MTIDHRPMITIDLTAEEVIMLRQLLTQIPYQFDAVEAHQLAWSVVEKLKAAGERKPEQHES
jgi:hypothetical protein